MIWLKDGACLGDQAVWMTAFTVVSALASGHAACGLADGSVAGNWRLPNVKEYLSLLDYGVHPGVLPAGHPFINFQSSAYLTSTTLTGAPEKMWWISMSDGQAMAVQKINGGIVTAVRGPE